MYSFKGTKKLKPLNISTVKAKPEDTKKEASPVEKKIVQDSNAKQEVPKNEHQDERKETKDDKGQAKEDEIVEENI
jgi:hypothetical protein